MKHTLIGDYIKRERKNRGLTQIEFAKVSGLGLNFVRDLEQGKPALRMDKVNQALYMFGAITGPVKIKDVKDEEG
ncbi:MAG: helix-turn-helix transcriptional regulator [Spirochaetaceae bacterium]|nr:helix-turn-helix transcriptional regulator [Spirochaetaceae bacterium]